jgi:hypothetical protein
MQRKHAARVQDQRGLMDAAGGAADGGNNVTMSSWTLASVDVTAAAAAQLGVKLELKLELELKPKLERKCRRIRRSSLRIFADRYPTTLEF